MDPRKGSPEELWKQYLKTQSHEDRNVLVEQYVPLVQLQAARLSRKLPVHIGYEEICSAGYEGLIEAVEGYNPDRNVKFETF